MKTLTWWATSCSGGLCDRLLGIITSLAIAKELKRRFFIKWDTVDISKFIKINPQYNYYTYEFTLDFINLDNYQAKEFFENEKDVESLSEKENILIWSNQNLFWHFCKGKSDVNYERKLKEAIEEFEKIFIFPNLIFHFNLEKYTGIHIRTIDKQIQEKELVQTQKEVIENIFEKVKKRKGDVPVFISSDCELAYDIAKNYFKEVQHNEGKIVHTAYTNEEEGWKKVLCDLFSLKKCKDLCIGWNSNFSRIAGILNWNREIFCYDTEKEVNFTELSSYFSDSRWRML